MSLLSGLASATSCSPVASPRGRVSQIKRLALGFVQSQAGQDPARLGDLIVDGVEGIRADARRAAAWRESCPRRTAARPPRSDPISRFRSTRKVGIAERGRASRRRRRLAAHAAARLPAPSAQVELDLLRVRNVDAEQLVRPWRWRSVICFGCDRLRIGIHDALGQLAAGGLQNQLRRAAGWPSRRCRCPRRARSGSWHRCASPSVLRGAPDVRRA